MTEAATEITPSEELMNLATENQKALGQLNELLTKQRKEIANDRETHTSTAKAIGEVEQKLNEHVERLLEQDKRISDLQATMNRGSVDSDVLQEMKSLGVQFGESDAYKRMNEKSTLSSDPMRFKTFWPHMERSFVDRQADAFLKVMEAKAGTLTSASGSGGSLVDLFATMRLQNIIAAPQEPFRLSQLIRVTPTQESAIEYVQQSNFNKIYTELASEAAASQKNVVVDNVNGFRPGSTIVLDPDGDGNGPESAIIDTVTLATNTIVVTENLSATHAIDDPVVSDVYNYSAETTLKPQARRTFTDVNVPMKTLATWEAVSRQVLSDVNRLRSHIDNELMASLASMLDEQILYGDGSADELSGIFANANVQTYSWSAGTAGDEKLDAIRRAMTLVLLARYTPDGIVLNPQDWEDIELMKGSDGHYIWVQVMTGGQPRLWALPVVVTQSCTAGDFGVGAWQLALEMFDRQQSMIRVSEHHEDFFTRNQVAVLAEARHALAAYRPEAIVYGSFDSKPT